MAITDYTSLSTQVANFLNRDDLTATVDEFIQMADADIARRVRHWRMEKRSSAQINSQYTFLPSDFLEPIRMILTDGNTSTLELTGSFAISEEREKGANRLGKPLMYAFHDGTIEFYPTPDTTYNLEMMYYAKTPDLSATAPNNTNWLLQYYPDAYLYGALVHSAPFLQEDERLPTWSALYQNAIDGINAESEKSKTSGSGRRIRIRSY